MLLAPQVRMFGFCGATGNKSRDVCNAAPALHSLAVLYALPMGLLLRRSTCTYGSDNFGVVFDQVVLRFVSTPASTLLHVEHIRDLRVVFNRQPSCPSSELRSRVNLRDSFCLLDLGSRSTMQLKPGSPQGTRAGYRALTHVGCTTSRFSALAAAAQRL